MKRIVVTAGIAVVLAAAGVTAGVLSSGSASAAPGVQTAPNTANFARYALGSKATTGRGGAIDAPRPVCAGFVGGWYGHDGQTVVDVRHGATYGMTIIIVQQNGVTTAEDGPSSTGVVVWQWTVPIDPSTVTQVVAYAEQSRTTVDGSCNVPYLS